MKPLLYLLSLALLPSSLNGQELAVELKQTGSPQEIAQRVLARAEELAEVQDELSADVMELIESQTVPEVIALLEEVEQVMIEVIDDLAEGTTGGPTLAAETEVIEKILAAAQEKQQSSEDSSPESKESMGAMLDMMKRMTGKQTGENQGKEPSEEGEKPNGESSGNGSTGDSDTKNKEQSGKIGDENSVRIIPRGSAPPGTGLPNEFQKLLDAYNRNHPAKP